MIRLIDFTSYFVFSSLSLLVVLLFHLWVSLPSDEEIRGCITTKMFNVKLCANSKSYASLNNISDYLKQAVIVAEDAAFYQHEGFDWDELKESFNKNIDTMSFSRGGSTITQQLAKNMFLSSEKSLLRKLKEAIITFRLEKILSKKEILEKYLNIVEFGPNLYGVKNASQFYFNKTPAQLNVLESAFLAFLLPNPETHSVSFRKKALTRYAQKRIFQIVQRMYLYDRIDEDTYQTARANLHGFPWREGMTYQPSSIVDQIIKEVEEAGGVFDESEEVPEEEIDMETEQVQAVPSATQSSKPLTDEELEQIQKEVKKLEEEIFTEEL